MEEHAEKPEIAVALDESFFDHVAPGFHPERPERLVAARRGLESTRAKRVGVPIRVASAEELSRVHAPAYIERLERALRQGHGYLDGDTFFSPGTHNAAWRAAGAACELMDRLLGHGLAAGANDASDPTAMRTGVLLPRPPGHHATRDRAMGFCVVNNVAVAAAHARARGVERVAIVDWDVHHGNGTQDIFAGEPGVLFISLHQWPLYPGTGDIHETGRDEARGRTLNVPLPPGAGSAAYRAAFDRIVLRALDAYAPELVLLSAGFDAHERDPLGGMHVDTETFGWMAAKVAQIARRFSSGRIGMLLEGGYDLRALEDSVRATVDAISGAVAPETDASDRPQDVIGEDAESVLRRVVETHRPLWPSGTF